MYSGANQTLDNSQMSWVYSLVTQALANLIVDINGLTFRVEMLRRVPAAENPLAGVVESGEDMAIDTAALGPQHPRQADRRRRCRLTLNNQEVSVTPAGFGPTVEAVAAAQTVAGNVVWADPPLADGPLHNADELRGQIGVVERGSVSFVEKARRLQAAGAAAVMVMNVADVDYVPLGMVGDPGFDIAVPVVCVRRSCSSFLGHPAQQSSADRPLHPCRATLTLDGAATVDDQSPARGVGGTPARALQPEVSLGTTSPVTVQAVLLDDPQLVASHVTTVTVDALDQVNDNTLVRMTSAPLASGGVAPGPPPLRPSGSFRLPGNGSSASPVSASGENPLDGGLPMPSPALSAVNASVNPGADADATSGETAPAQYAVEPAWTLVFVFDVVRSHSTDAAWRDVQIDAATGEPVDTHAPPEPSGPEAGKAAAEGDDGGSGPPNGRGADGRGALHRVVDFSNLVVYVCEETILDGLDFTLRIKLRPDPENLRHVDVTIPTITLMLSQVQVRLLLRWYEWFMTPLSEATEVGVSRKQSPVKGTRPEEAAGGPDGGEVDPSWLGWAWGMVVGDEDEEGAGAGGPTQRPAGVAPDGSAQAGGSAQADSGGVIDSGSSGPQAVRSNAAAGGNEALIQEVKSTYKTSQAVFLMYVMEFDILLRYEDDAIPTRLPIQNLASGKIAGGIAGGGGAQSGWEESFARFRFRELLIDQSKKATSPMEVTISSSFADVFALAGCGMRELESEGLNPQGLPVVICGPEPEQQQRQAHAAAPAEEAEAAPAAGGSVYGSLADNGLDGLDESEDQESFTGPEPPRPVPSEPPPPRSRHAAAAICVKVRAGKSPSQSTVACD